VTAVEYLDLEDLLGFVRALGAGPVRDAGLLDAACARPRSTPFGEDAYPTLEEKAAALLHSLVRNHALVDGNNRLGWLATAVFLDLNDHPPSLSDNEAFALVMAIAEGALDVDEIAGRLGTE
jgi:death on curing protein